MDRVSPQAIVAIERDLTAHLIREFALDVRQVLFDATNFFTFIDTFNRRCTLARRGHSKEGRAALRIVGLALLVTTDFHIPLCHHTYPGNQPDSPTFAEPDRGVGPTPSRSWPRRSKTSPWSSTRGITPWITSEPSIEVPTTSSGRWSRASTPSCWRCPSRTFAALAADGLPGVSAYRTTKVVFGKERD